MSRIGDFDLNTPEGMQGWIIDHEAKINVMWQHQREWNVKTEKKQDDNVKRISRLESKIALYGSLAGGLAGLVLQFVPKILQAVGSGP